MKLTKQNKKLLKKVVYFLMGFIVLYVIYNVFCKSSKEGLTGGSTTIAGLEDKAMKLQITTTNEEGLTKAEKFASFLRIYQNAEARSRIDAEKKALKEKSGEGNDKNKNAIQDYENVKKTIVKKIGDSNLKAIEKLVQSDPQGPKSGKNPFYKRMSTQQDQTVAILKDHLNSIFNVIEHVAKAAKK